MNARITPTRYMISLFAALILAASIPAVLTAQQVETIESTVRLSIQDEIPATAVADATRAYWTETQEPPEIRIMSRIIQTALSDVEAPELPEEITEESEQGKSEFAYITALGERLRRTVAVAPSAIGIYSGSRRVSGFYMNGYGYLFTIRWPIRSTSLLSSFYAGGSENLVLQLQAQNRTLERLLVERSDRVRRDTERAEAGREKTEEELKREQEELQQQQEELALKIETWRSEFEDRLVSALQDVLATYGHTLHRAAPEESITFILEQSDDEEDNVTLSVKKSELGGPTEKERALRAIRISRGSEETNPALKSQVRIMAEIIDAAFESEEEGEFRAYISHGDIYFGGEARTQYIPGYGVIFRKNARVSAVAFVSEVTPPDVPTEERRARQFATVLGERSEESLEKLREHFENLKMKTAEILATYGNTLTELADEEWIGINYDVGSGASLLQSGVSNFLVLVQMSRVREAAHQGEDAAEWLLEHLVTNERDDL